MSISSGTSSLSGRFSQKAPPAFTNLVEGVGFRLWGLRFRVEGLAFRVEG